MTGLTIDRHERERILTCSRYINEWYGMKDVMRYKYLRDLPHWTDSVAEHCWGMYFIAPFFADQEGITSQLDWKKLGDMISVHDGGELGMKCDISCYDKTESDREEEHEKFKDLVNRAPNGFEFLRKAYDELTKSDQGLECKFLSALDKIEPAFQLFDDRRARQHFRKQPITKNGQMKRQLAYTEGFPVMQKYVWVINDDLESRGLFLDE